MARKSIANDHPAHSGGWCMGLAILCTTVYQLALADVMIFSGVSWFRWLFSRERDRSEHIDDEELLRRVRLLDATALRSAIDESLRPLDMLNRPFHPFMRLAPDEDDIVEPAINEKIVKASDAFLDEMAKPVLKYSAEGMKVIEERNARVVHFVAWEGVLTRIETGHDCPAASRSDADLQSARSKTARLNTQRLAQEAREGSIDLDREKSRLK